MSASKPKTVKRLFYLTENNSDRLEMLSVLHDSNLSETANAAIESYYKQKGEKAEILRLMLREARGE